MGNFRRNDRSSGRRDFGRPSFRDRDRTRQMYDATCSECGKDCQIPFQPSSNKPVFCSQCFEKKGGGSNSRRFEDRSDRRPQNNLQFEAINSKLDKILSILAPAPSPVEQPITPETEKEIVIQPEKPAAPAEKKPKASKKAVPTPKAA